MNEVYPHQIEEKINQTPKGIDVKEFFNKVEKINTVIENNVSKLGEKLSQEATESAKILNNKFYELQERFGNEYEISRGLIEAYNKREDEALVRIQQNHYEEIKLLLS